jgi:coatomer subunit beta
MYLKLPSGVQVVLVLKKEIMKTQSTDSGDKAGDYRQLLVQAIHSCAVKFPDVAGSVVYLLMDFMGDSNTASALDVVFFVREIMETNAKLRDDILQHLMNTFYQIRSSRVCTCALWITGEYATSMEQVEAAIEVIKSGMGPLPFYGEDGSSEDEAKAGKSTEPLPSVVRPAVLSDGTYATQVWHRLCRDGTKKCVLPVFIILPLYCTYSDAHAFFLAFLC